MSFLIFVSLSLLSVLALYYFFFLKQKPQQEDDKISDQEDNDNNEVEIQRGNRRGVAQRIRNRRRNQGAEDSELEEDQELDEAAMDPDRKLTKKELHKMQKKQEKERMKEAMRQHKEEQEQRRLQQEAKEQEDEERRKQEELAILEEERLRKEEEAKKEQEEYNQWKDMFVVESQGDTQQDDAEYENKLQQFLEFIELRKVVLFEDLAAEFNLSTKDVIDRIQSLMESGRLKGITDDRGKFIHITDKEFEAVARYIKTKGRVNKSDLLAECNRLVRLQPRAEDKAKIQREQQSLLEKVQKEFVKEEEVAA